MNELSLSHIRLDHVFDHVGETDARQRGIDARKHEAVISPSAIDLSAYDSIYLGSLIWLYSPAPPIWQFVELNKFDSKHVVLFNTFNSQFQPEYIEAFRARVMGRGAKSFEHHYIRRERMGQQL